MECTFKPHTRPFKGVSGEDRKNKESMYKTEDNLFVEVKKPFSMPAKRLGKHRAFELYSLAKPRAQRIDRDPDEIEYEKFCDECTFAPDLTSTKNRNDFTSNFFIILSLTI